MDLHLEGGNIKVYTGPKGGKYFINKQGKKSYIDKKSYNNTIQYKKDTKKK